MVEQLERLALQLDADSALPQFAGTKVGFEDAKPDFPRLGRESVRAWNANSVSQRQALFLTWATGHESLDFRSGIPSGSSFP